MFYKSSNYGGILQAYALTKVLRNMGIKASQICYEMTSAYSLERRIKMKAKKWLAEVKQYKKLSVLRKIKKREKIVQKAAKDIIPHTKKAYSEKNIQSCLGEFDSFITGSDQVWSQEWPAYFLSFVPEGRKKIAYAVSVGNSMLPQNEIEYIKKYTKTFTAISAREEETANKLDEIIENTKVELVIDPTLLLESNDWKEVTSPRIISSPYLFCYFLGSDPCLRKLASEYAKEKNLIIVTIPHMQQRVEVNDLNFGDVQVFNASPQDFLSYIQYASAIFTDSFHASVFSHIFKKQYYVFTRKEFTKMSNRITTLTYMFGSGNHFISETEGYTLENINSIKDIDYSLPADNYNKKKRDSLLFLQQSLGA